MPINISIQFNHPDALAHRVRYGRIDNTLNPVFLTVSPDPVTSPANIATDIPNGQYRVFTRPLYADGRECPETFEDTPACPGLISINAYITGDTLVAQYLAPPDVPKVRITVNYPNGGSYTANYVNNGNDIPIAIPSNLYGDFTVYGQSVCDEASGFYSPLSSQVTVSRSNTNVIVTNNATGLSLYEVAGITGFNLQSSVPSGSSSTGQHQAFVGGISVYFTGIPSTQSAVLKKNGVTIQCVDLVSGFAAGFTSETFLDTDVITIELNNGACP